jgi:hypothetical protein
MENYTSYCECRNCGMFHNSTSRDCGVDTIVINFSIVPSVWGYRDGLWYGIR